MRRPGRPYRAWPGGELFVIEDVAHNAGAPGLADAPVAETVEYAGR